jgi:integrase
MAMKNAGAMQPVIEDLNQMTEKWKRLPGKARPAESLAMHPPKSKKAENNRQKITQRLVKELANTEGENRIVWDAELKGFGVRVTANGAISYFLNYRSHGRQRRYKIGNHPEWTAEAARAEAAEIKPKIKKGYDPLEEEQKARGEPTLRDLANGNANTKLRDKQTIDGVILPRLGTLQLKAINTYDIEKLHRDLGATPYRANRVLALLSSMFNEAIEWKRIKENPARGIDRYQEHKRERWLQDDELKRLTTALDKYPDQSAANAIRLIALTGSRKSEVLKAKWDEFDLERGVWTKPSHHTKQKKVEHVPLSRPALELLCGMFSWAKEAHALEPEIPMGPLFLGKDGKAARVSIRKPWTQVCKSAGLAEAITKKGKRRHAVTKYKPCVRIHDLRHTFASHLVTKGISLQKVGQLIGHTQISTTMRYAHLADSALREATNTFGDIFNAAGATAQAGLQVVPPKAARRKRAAGE